MRRLTRHEHEIEDFAAARFAEAGHALLKFISPGFPGVPDRIVVASGGRVFFIEFKAPGQRPRRTQPKVIKMLKDMGHRVEIVDTYGQVNQILKELAA